MQTSAMERVAPEKALAVEERVKVPAPIAEVYRRWLDFSRFPEFMEPIQEVRPLGGGAITGRVATWTPGTNGRPR